MQLIHLALLLLITLAPSLSQKLTPNAVASLLQGILSPKNTEQVIQVLSAAANKKRTVGNVPGTANRRIAITDNVPRMVVRNEATNGIAQLLQRPQEISQKQNVMVPNMNTVLVQNGKQILLPNNMVLQRRIEKGVPKNVVIQNGGDVTVPRNIISRKNETPKRMFVQNNDFSLRIPQMRVPEGVQQKVFTDQLMRPEVQQNVLIRQPQVAEYVTAPQQKVLIRNENPFLPAASPISPLTALSSSSGLPPGIPQSRGQFLRKIPIPPPTI